MIMEGGAFMPEKLKTPCNLGLLAHVDAGKTTLSEALLYVSGAKRTLGRVDHRDAHLDTHVLERERGITIFSKQALFSTENHHFTLVDTPGHVDFSAEAERTLQILDCAVLLISGTDGIQAHTLTLWRLLERYHVPTVLFINKMDLPGCDRQKLITQLQQELSTGCVDFGMEIDQIEYAAEIAIEHHLGLTCDPIRGLVQIPCIERNAVAAMRAINAVSLANFLTDSRKISFDLVVKTMYETGRDLAHSYRETATGGLAKLYT
jgi:small GTP-binding protein